MARRRTQFKADQLAAAALAQEYRQGVAAATPVVASQTAQAIAGMQTQLRDQEAVFQAALAAEQRQLAAQQERQQFALADIAQNRAELAQDAALDRARLAQDVALDRQRNALAGEELTRKAAAARADAQRKTMEEARKAEERNRASAKKVVDKALKDDNFRAAVDAIEAADAPTAIRLINEAEQRGVYGKGGPREGIDARTLREYFALYRAAPSQRTSIAQLGGPAYAVPTSFNEYREMRAYDADRARTRAEGNDGGSGAVSSVLGGLVNGALGLLTATGSAALEGVEQAGRAVNSIPGYDAAQRAALRAVPGLSDERANAAGNALNALGRAEKTPGRRPENLRDALTGNANLGGDSYAGTALGALDTVGTALVDPLTYVGVGLAGRAGQAAKGITFGGRTVVPAARIPGSATATAAREAFAQSAAGKALRNAFVPFARTTDYAGREVAEAAEIALHRQRAFTGGAAEALDNRLDPLVEAAGTAQYGRIRNALETGQVDLVARELVDEGDSASAALLKELDAIRRMDYDDLRKAGVPEDDLRDPRQYLRHVLTEDGRATLGLPPLNAPSRNVSRAGTLRGRKIEGTIDELADEGLDYVDDPVKLIRSSSRGATEVLSNARLADELGEAARKQGLEIVRDTPKAGWTKIAPDRYLPDDIARDVFNLQKAGTHRAAVRNYDHMTGIIRGLTILNPLNAPGYLARNLQSSVLFNVINGVVDPTLYSRAFTLRKALNDATKSLVGKSSDDKMRAALAAQGLDERQVAEAMAMRKENIIPPGRAVYDDLYELAPQTERGRKLAKEGPWGTRTANKVNQLQEDTVRGAHFLRKLDEGLDSGEAARLTRRTHIDYSAVGFTRFERDYVKRVAFFYSFLRKAPPMIVRATVQRPGTAAILQRAGLGFTDPDTPVNEYGDPIGPYLETPGQFVSQLPYELEGIVDDPEGQGVPLLQLLLDPESRRDPEEAARTALPPVDKFLRDLEAVTSEDDEKLERLLRGLVGVKTGVDYSKERQR